MESAFHARARGVAADLSVVGLAVVGLAAVALFRLVVAYGWGGRVIRLVLLADRAGALFVRLLDFALHGAVEFLNGGLHFFARALPHFGGRPGLAIGFEGGGLRGGGLLGFNYFPLGFGVFLDDLLEGGRLGFLVVCFLVRRAGVFLLGGGGSDEEWADAEQHRE
jgi:hypothetical protein